MKFIEQELSNRDKFGFIVAVIVHFILGFGLAAVIFWKP